MKKPSTVSVLTLSALKSPTLSHFSFTPYPFQTHCSFYLWIGLDFLLHFDFQGHLFPLPRMAPPPQLLHHLANCHSPLKSQLGHPFLGEAFLQPCHCNPATLGGVVTLPSIPQTSYISRKNTCIPDYAFVEAARLTAGQGASWHRNTSA